MKPLRLLVAGALIGLGASTFIKVSNASPPPCSTHYMHDVVVSTPTASIAAEVAKTPQQREMGLSGRACIKSDEGMLFVFDHPGLYPFWMKDMKFSIDMIWMDANHRIVKIQSNVAPTTYPQNFVNTTPAQYVLEIQAGQAQALNLVIGSSLQFNP
jgi:uncharacterized protein